MCKWVLAILFLLCMLNAQARTTAFYLDLNTDFDQNTFGTFPTLFDFNRSRVSLDGNVTHNGQLDWNNQTLAQWVSDQNLVAWIDFEDSNSTSVLDNTEYHNDFNKANSATVIKNGVLGSSSGVVDGTDDSFQHAMVSISKLNFSTGSWGGWAKSNTSNYTANAQILNRNNTNSGTVGIRLTSADKVQCIMRLDGNESNVSSISANSTIDTSWHHYFCTYDGSTLQMYVDSVLQTQTLSLTGIIDRDSAEAYSLGATLTGAQPFNGQFDEVRIYDRVLSAAEIDAIYDEGVLNSNLLFYYQFNDRNATHAEDLSLNSRDLSITPTNNDINAQGLFDTNAFNSQGIGTPATLATSTLISANTAFTLIMWAKTSDTDLSSAISQNDASQALFSGFRLGIGSGSNCGLGVSLTVRWLYDANVADGNVLCSSVTASDNKWHHVAIVGATGAGPGDGTTIIYVDSVDVNSVTQLLAPVAGASNLTIGADTSGATYANYFTGQIEEVRLYNTALSAAQVLADYNAWWSSQYLSRVLDANTNGTCTDCNFSKGRITFDVNAAMSRLRMFSRACTDTNCSTNPSFVQEQNFSTRTEFDLNNGTGYRTRFLQFRLDLDVNTSWDGSIFDANLTHVQDVNVFLTSFDQTAPITTDDHNSDWQKTDANVHLTCTDTNGSGCATTQYRLDTDSNSAITMGSWTTFDQNILITQDGNWAIDYNSTDASGNMETTNRIFVLVDKNAPTVVISSPASGATISSSTVTIQYSATDANSGVSRFWVSDNNSTWIDKNQDTNHSFTSQSNGSHTYYVIATDNADNNGSAQISVTVSVSTDTSSGSTTGGGGGGGGGPSSKPAPQGTVPVLATQITDWKFTENLLVNQPVHLQVFLENRSTLKNRFWLKITILQANEIQFFTEQQTPSIDVNHTASIDVLEPFVLQFGGSHEILIEVLNEDKNQILDSFSGSFDALGKFRYDLVITCLDSVAFPSQDVSARLTLLNLGDFFQDVDLAWWIQNAQGQHIGQNEFPLALYRNETRNLVRSIRIPTDTMPGEYLFVTQLSYQDSLKHAQCPFWIEQTPTPLEPDLPFQSKNPLTVQTIVAIALLMVLIGLFFMEQKLIREHLEPPRAKP